ncbi:oligopeptidase A [Alkalilimnicola ehrlichii]|uniref:oligopeptidase A n=1 Tax=Alkalilimnicola ehrlichii TaxID=351052 RepID=UPI003BA10625
MSDNPLLRDEPLPPFPEIQPEHVEPAIDELLAHCRQTLGEVLERGDWTWDGLVAPLEAADERLSRAWSPVSHMNAVVNTEALRAGYNACLPKLSAYATEVGQNAELCAAFHALRDSEEYQALDSAQQRTIDNALRDFRLSGVDLPADQKQRYGEIAQRLSELSAKFGENVLDATNAWHKDLSDAEVLSGLPDSSLALARQTAERAGVEGYRINLEFPSFFAVITYADDRALRREVYEAWSTRASERGPHGGQWDNLPLMEEILALRHEKARLLGYDNFAELSLAKKMAGSTDEVLGFLNDLAERARPRAEDELAELRRFAGEELGLTDLQAWDIPYASEKLRQARFQLSDEDLRPYFPAERVMAGLFEVVQRLYGLHIEERQGVPVWHEDVRYYEIRDRDGDLRGAFYTDLYARPHKRGGAWMDECRARMRQGERVQVPVAYLTCNFTPAVGDQPALLTHGEVTTLFHEFGHGLHHMLTRVEAPAVAGIRGVAWDAVELPSQFMENWCWEREALDLFAAHYQTGARIPEDRFRRMRAARNFQSAMQMVRQLEFSLFDFRLHAGYDPERGARIYPLLDEVREQVAVVRPPEWNRFANSFGHIFAGGYAAGYYSYKWAEVLSADAYSRFEEEGIFNQQAGHEFMTHILEKGGSEDPMVLFRNFRGRAPRIDALLRHSGLAA